MCCNQSVNQRQHEARERGFTIVELMVALTILTIILVMGTIIMTQIGRLYAKGVNAANLQNASRSIIADTSSALEFSGIGLRTGCSPQPSCTANPATATVQSYCLGNARYTFVVGKELGTDEGGPHGPVTTNHVLWRDTLTKPDSSTCPPVGSDASCANPSFRNPGNPSDCFSDSSQGGFEMVGDHMRLVDFDIEPVGDTFTITLNMLFGDSDLQAPPDAQHHALCQGGPGTAYCSISNITTIVTRRIK